MGARARDQRNSESLNSSSQFHANEALGAHHVEQDVPSLVTLSNDPN